MPKYTTEHYWEGNPTTKKSKNCKTIFQCKRDKKACLEFCGV